MRWIPGLLFSVFVIALHAQASEDPDVARARLEVARIAGLVQSGALPPVQLEKARAALADAEDTAIVRRDIQQSDLTEEEAARLVAAAQRRFDHRAHEYDEAKQLVAAGAAPQLSLGAYLRNLDFARKEYDLAETRARLAREIDLMARAEEALATRLNSTPAEAAKLADRYDGNGTFNPQIFERVQAAFRAEFGHALPVSANGQTAVHRALGFDHRGRVDVALHPDQPEGVWLRHYLMQNRIPFIAFRQAVPGKATAAHIHMGPLSTRL